MAARGRDDLCGGIAAVAAMGRDGDGRRGREAVREAVTVMAMTAAAATGDGAYFLLTVMFVSSPCSTYSKQ